MSEVGTTLVGLNVSYRIKMVFSSSEPASHSKPKMQDVTTGSSNQLGSTDEETGEELKHEDCISGDKSYDNI